MSHAWPQSVQCRWPWLAAGHLPAAAWAVWIEWSGGICPLTPLELRLRQAAGQQGYGGGFIEHYLTAAIYPEGLTRELQFAIGGFVLALNAAILASSFIGPALGDWTGLAMALILSGLMRVAAGFFILKWG